MKRIWLHFWAYWKWFCTALVTSTILLLLVAIAIDAVMSAHTGRQDPAGQCLEHGGAWMAEEGACRHTS